MSLSDPSVSVTLSAPCRSIKCHQGRIRKQRVRRVNASVGSNVKIIRGIAGNAKCCDVPLFIVRRHPQMSTQSRPRTSAVEAKGQDDQEIVVDAKVKAIQVDDLFPPSRGKRTFVQSGSSWAAATFRGLRVGRVDLCIVSSVPTSTICYGVRLQGKAWTHLLGAHDFKAIHLQLRDKATADPSSQ